MARTVALPGIDQASIVRRPNHRGRPEIFEARSTDQEWGFERGEEAGTPWHIHHYPTGGVLECAATTLKGALYLATHEKEWVLDQMARRAALVVGAAA